MSSWPPAPWRLEGRVLLIPELWAAQRPSSRATFGGILVAEYDERSTLAYSELLVAGGPTRLGARIGWRISHAYVDDRASMAGGREIWCLPKQLATFDWRPGGWGVRVRRDQRVLIEVRATRPRLRWPQPGLAPFVGDLEGRTAFGLARGVIFGGPVRLRVSVPEDSDLRSRSCRPLGIGFAGRCRIVVLSPATVSRGDGG